MLVVWKGIMWVCFCSSCASGVFGGILLGQVNGYKIGASYGFFVVNFEWTLDGRFGRILGWKIWMNPGWVIWKDYWL